jgi:predicted nuclease with RNAse H fold
VITAGIDLSAEFKNTWMATIDWVRGEARLVGLQSAVSDSDILRAALTADQVGIDCPFGWPESFYEFISQHREGGVKPQVGLGKEWRENLAFRATDLAIKQQWPGSSILSVSSDKLGRVAMRCAALLASMTAAGIDVDRSGMTGSVVEIYPAASLRAWNQLYSGYKSNTGVLSGMVDDLVRQAPWLRLSEGHLELCRNVHDAFDAVIASLTARAAALGRATGPSQNQMVSARLEGWIRLPHAGSLADLVNE